MTAEFPAIDERIERVRRMRHEIGEGHFAGEDERHDPGIGAHQKQGGADRFEEGRENEQAVQRGDRGGGGKVEQFREPMLEKQEPDDDAQDAENKGPNLSILA